ncbi:hypothetical protein ALT761_01994 [Alteromonas sp. 76-1]|jgi:hypothetical protein|uniref:hypothetical protein n=1 Tax=Alteromonas sp. 76-1 TaxID=2358187 RepID=UPI000FD161FA|nr:hypothetical protein [Alteromonas sp. 76-1]VEL96995.1 hypothetical protein ALT761_01994 [Alteromonas sp. 76-1]
MSKVVSVDSKEAIAEMKRMSRALNVHRKGEVNRAMAATINDSLKRSRTKIVRRASKAMQVKQAPIRSRVKITRAKTTNLNGKVWAGTNRLSARTAGAKPRGDGHATGPYEWSNTFTNSGLKNIYIRKGQGRGNIEVAGFGAKFTERALVNAVNTETEAALSKDFPAELFRQLKWRLDKALGIK